MNTNTQKSLVAAAFLLAVATQSTIAAAAADKPTQEVIDAKQESQIWTTYALSPYLRANDLQVSVHDGKAVLTGTVEDDVNKDLAKQIAIGVKGIREVDNKIVVKGDYTPAKADSKDRSYGQMIDDASITAAIKSKMLWGKNTSGLSANVDTLSGRVKLQGTAENGAAKELAGRIAKNTHGVIAVDNQLKVKKDDKQGVKDDAKKTVSDVGDNVSDSWITTKVKSTFIYSSNVGSSDISVATNEGVVTLSGKVSSGAERELAIALAENIRGVKSVKSTDLTI